MSLVENRASITTPLLPGAAAQQSSNAWRCWVCNNINYNHRRRCNLTVCGAVQGFPGPYRKFDPRQPPAAAQAPPSPNTPLQNREAPAIAASGMTLLSLSSNHSPIHPNADSNVNADAGLCQLTFNPAAAVDDSCGLATTPSLNQSSNAPSSTPGGGGVSSNGPPSNASSGEGTGGNFFHFHPHQQLSPWTCTKCGNRNRATRDNCHRPGCDALRVSHSAPYLPSPGNHHHHSTSNNAPGPHQHNQQAQQSHQNRPPVMRNAGCFPTPNFTMPPSGAPGMWTSVPAGSYMPSPSQPPRGPVQGPAGGFWLPGASSTTTVIPGLGAPQGFHHHQQHHAGASNANNAPPPQQPSPQQVMWMVDPHTGVPTLFTAATPPSASAAPQGAPQFFVVAAPS